MSPGFELFGVAPYGIVAPDEPLESLFSRPMEEPWFGDEYGKSFRFCIPPLSIEAAVAQPPPRSTSIFFRLISSAISDIRTQSMAIGVG